MNAAVEKANTRRAARGKPFLLLGVSAGTICACIVLLFNSSLFGVAEFATTMFVLILSLCAFSKRVWHPTQALLVFVLLLLLAIHPLKGVYLAVLTDTGMQEFLPTPLRRGISQEIFTEAYFGACVLVMLVAVLILSFPNNGKRNFIHWPEYHVDHKFFLVLLLGLFVVTTSVRILIPQEGFLLSVNYVVNHRVFPFGMSFLVFLLVLNNDIRMARWVFFLWLFAGVLQFLLYGSKSYLILPVVTMLMIPLLSRARLFPRGLIVVVMIALFVLYPIMNIYRSLVIYKSLDASMVLTVYELSLMQSRQLAGALEWLRLTIVAINPLLERLIGMESYLLVLQGEQAGALPSSGDFLQNARDVGTIMRMHIMGIEVENIGIAPSLMGFSYIVLRSFTGTLLLSLGFIVALVGLYHLLTTLLPKISGASFAPLALVVFSMVTDGNVWALYWDLPAVIIVCSMGFVFTRKKQVSRDGQVGSGSHQSSPQVLT
jgi:hypothetical protein